MQLLAPQPWAHQPEAHLDDWSSAWRFCCFHGVRPALREALEQPSRSGQAPLWLHAELADFKRQHGFAVLHKTAEIVDLAKVLEAAGLEATFFKGAVLGQQVYGAAQSREFNDIDLLVAHHKRERAAELLEACGYLPIVRDQHIRRAFFDYAGQHMFRHRDTGSVVDLHWNFVGDLPFPVDAAEVLRNRTNLPLGGGLVPVPSIEDLGLILAGHGQKEGWASFGWALDFARFAAKFPDFDWGKASDRSRARGARLALLTAMLLMERLFGRVIDEELVVAARQRSEIVADVERIVIGYKALAERKLADDLMGSFRLCETSAQRAKVWWGLLTTRTIGDYEALPLPPRWWRIYHLTRPVRLIWQKLRSTQPSKSAFFEEQKKT